MYCQFSSFKIYTYLLSAKEKRIKLCKKKKIKLLSTREKLINGYFPCTRLRQKQTSSRKMPPTQQGIYLTKTKQKQLQNPFSITRSHFTAINFLVTTDILEQLKDGEKGLRYQIKPYSETKPCQKEGGVKIMKSSISAQFKSCIGDIPNMRTIKGGKKVQIHHAGEITCF